MELSSLQEQESPRIFRNQISNQQEINREIYLVLLTLGTRAQIPTGYMVKTLRA